MFITPIPPTKRDIPATKVTNIFKVDNILSKEAAAFDSAFTSYSSYIPVISAISFLASVILSASFSGSFPSTINDVYPPDCKSKSLS